MGEKFWSLATTGAAIGASIFAKKITEKTWTFVTGGSSPSNPEDPDINWGEAIAFALLSGAIVQLLKMMVNRESTQAFKKRTGRLPKSVEQS